MRECKILEFGVDYNKHDLKYSPVSLADYPEVEKELNQYLAQGFQISSMSFKNSAYLVFLLER